MVKAACSKPKGAAMSAQRFAVPFGRENTFTIHLQGVCRRTLRQHEFIGKDVHDRISLPAGGNIY